MGFSKEDADAATNIMYNILGIGAGMLGGVGGKVIKE